MKIENTCSAVIQELCGFLYSGKIRCGVGMRSRMCYVGWVVWVHELCYAGCPRRNVPDFGRMFLMLNCTDITQNTYIQSWTVTEIITRERLVFIGVDVLYAVRDVILAQCACPTNRHRNAVTLACALQRTVL